MIAFVNRIKKTCFRSDWAFGSYLTELNRKRAIGIFLYMGVWRGGEHPQIDLGERSGNF